MKGKIIFVTGVSGTGKSAVYRELKSRGVSTIGIDEEGGLCYWFNKKTGQRLVQKANFTKEFIDAHGWVCDLVELEKLINKSIKPVVVCGSIDNIVEALNLSDKSLLLVCSPETSFARIDAREDNEYGKSEGAKEAFLSYYQKYNQDCIDSGSAIIDAEKSLSEVVEDVLLYIK